MKNTIKRIVVAATFLLSYGLLSAQTYTNIYPSPLQKVASKWLKKAEWKNFFTKALPAPAVNAVEFYIQYSRNAKQWNAMFAWLESHDLLAMPAGRVPIGDTGLVASIEDGQNWCSEEDLEDGKGSESHRQKIDFMYVVDGSEGFALLDHDTSVPLGDYKPDVEHYQFEANKLKRFESIPGTFNIMFPCDWHIAKIKTGRGGEHVKVIVVKMDYVL